MPYNPIAYRIRQSMQAADRKLADADRLLGEAIAQVRAEAPGPAKDALIQLTRSINGAISAVVAAQSLEFALNHPHIRIIRDEKP